MPPTQAATTLAPKRSDAGAVMNKLARLSEPPGDCNTKNYASGRTIIRSDDDFVKHSWLPDFAAASLRPLTATHGQLWWWGCEEPPQRFRRCAYRAVLTDRRGRPEHEETVLRLRRIVTKASASASQKRNLDTERELPDLDPYGRARITRRLDTFESGDVVFIAAPPTAPIAAK
jgi:hypothetical protein